MVKQDVFLIPTLLGSLNLAVCLCPAGYIFIVSRLNNIPLRLARYYKLMHSIDTETIQFEAKRSLLDYLFLFPLLIFVGFAVIFGIYNKIFFENHSVLFYFYNILISTIVVLSSIYFSFEIFLSFLIVTDNKIILKTISTKCRIHEIRFDEIKEKPSYVRGVCILKTISRQYSYFHMKNYKEFSSVIERIILHNQSADKTTH